MLHAAVSRNVAVDAETVWSLLADWGNTRWIKNFENAELIQSEKGLIRRMMIPNLGFFDEILLSRSDQEKSFRYTIPCGPIFPFDDYIGTVVVSAASGGESTVLWRCDFNSNMLSTEDAVSKAEGNLNHLLNMLTEYLGDQKANG